VLRIAPEVLHDLRLTTAPAEARPSGEGVTALGELGVNEDAYAEIGAPVAARVVRVLAGLGDTVAPEQPLIELHSPEVAQATADYHRAAARLRLAHQALQRRRALAAEKIVPQRELQEADAEAAAAGAELTAARSSLRALGLREDDLRRDTSATAVLALRSPIGGVVIERNALLGQMAEPGTALFRIADLSRLWLIAHVFERDAVRIRSGSAARATFPALPARSFSGIVTQVGRRVDVGSRTIPVRIEIANQDELLRPGMSASAWMPLADATETVVALPPAAEQRRDQGRCVY
jgi:cobalt-zinc-cadmium efflux system membrane fusion protein